MLGRETFEVAKFQQLNLLQRARSKPVHSRPIRPLFPHGWLGRPG